MHHDNNLVTALEKKNTDYSTKITGALSLVKETKIFFNLTLGLQARDISRMPFPSSPDTERRVSALAQQCVNVKKDALQFTNERLNLFYKIAQKYKWKDHYSRTLDLFCLIAGINKYDLIKQKISEASSEIGRTDSTI